MACPRVEHAISYQQMFGLKPIAPPRQYYGVGSQTQLLARRVSQIYPRQRNLWVNGTFECRAEGSACAPANLMPDIAASAFFC